MRQLELYYKIGMTAKIEESSAYQKWLYEREVELSRACGQAPGADKIRFEDEHDTGAASAEFDLRCRKCR